MAAKTSTDSQTTQDIVIERRELIARISPSPYGDEPMIVAAFKAIAAWFADDPGEHGYVGFDYLGRHYGVEWSPQQEQEQPIGNY